MHASSVIEAFGGRGAIASLTGAKPNAVTQWRRDGIPARYWHILVIAAGERGIADITFDALRASKPAPVASSSEAA